MTDVVGLLAAAVIRRGAGYPHLVVLLAGLIGILAVLVYAGVVLPAVWSAKPARRKAAAQVLDQILSLLRRR